MSTGAWTYCYRPQGKGNVFTGVCLSTIGLMVIRSLLVLVTARSIRILLECFLVFYCVSPVVCTCPGPMPVPCSELAITMIYYKPNIEKAEKEVPVDRLLRKDYGADL